MALGHAEMEAVILDMEDRINSLEEKLREVPSRWGANEPPQTPFRLIAARSASGGSYAIQAIAGYPVAYDEEEEQFLPLEADTFDELSGDLIFASTVFNNNIIVGGDVALVFRMVEGQKSPGEWFVISSGRKYLAAAQQPGTMRRSGGSGRPVARVWPMGLSEETLDDPVINDENIFDGYMNDTPVGIRNTGVNTALPAASPWGSSDLWVDDTILDRAERLSNPLEAGIRGYIYSPWLNRFHACFAPCGDGEEPSDFDNQSRTTPLPTQPGT